MSQHDWIIKSITVLASAILVSLTEWIIYRRLTPRAIHKQQVWRESFLRAFHEPVQILVVLMTLSFLFSIIAEQLSFDGDTLKTVDNFRLFFLILFTFWVGMRFIRRVEEGMVVCLEKGETKIKLNDRTSVHAISQFSRVVLIIITSLIVLQSLGVRISALLAFGGVGALVLGLAAKDNLANFIGGMMIYWDRPFSVGDWIRSPDQEIEGTVENIGWRLTRIRTLDKRALYLPNGILSNIAIENPSRMTHRRIKTTLGVRYEDASKIIAITHDIDQMVRQYPDIDEKQTVLIYLSEFAPSSLNILIQAFTKATDGEAFQAVQQDIFLKVVDIVNKHGAECAYPTQTLHVDPTCWIKPEEK
ncbi:MAG: mechanosensitive ion channel protein MscS [Coxiella sp. RIFCSPHIGHO2_12_FULL_44_14]|nr:MAG: mechanosensitive ion channel protein MscS [Coxiella sp. RIFCSPHIGHO2_12_FULL_44_14]